MGRIRKRYAPEKETNGAQGFGVADALHSVKRRRLSDEFSDDNSRQSTENSRRDRDDGDDGDDGWQTVTSKSSRRNQQRTEKLKSRKDAYPKLYFDQPVTRPVTIEQLRDLALYVLADGVAPKWVGITNSKAISKVVVMMIPGWDNESLERSKILANTIPRPIQQESTQVEGDHGSENKPYDVDSDVDVISTNDGTSKSVKFSDESKDFSGLAAKNWDWFFDRTIPVKAPGDSKFNKVHSPLQAMLMVSETAKEANKNHVTDRQSRPNATPIANFIHTSDELREAEYPIHPAIFTSPEDASLEAARRNATGQSAAAGWIDSDVTVSEPSIPPRSPASRQDPISQGLNIYALDCEMVLTSDQRSSLARISLVSWPDGKVVIDKFVKPDLPIENYHTQYSGITPKILENVTTKLSDIQQELTRILTSSTILLGHSLESDLNALKMTHPFVVDTSMVYPHPRGLPLRSSLKFLANKYLKREIQKGGANGHDSVEDARAVLDLVKLKCEKGPKFGTTEAIGEPIFKRLSRHKGSGGRSLTTAIVEYGSSPERGLGKDASYAIGCQNDDEITQGMVRAIKGDENGSEIPKGGADFVWGRLRGLEFAKGWVTSTYKNSSSDSAISTNPANNDTTSNRAEQKTPEQTQSEVDRTILTVLSHIDTIRSALPPTTLLVLYSGTSDVRMVVELQNLLAQYRREFKTKKWDELTVRWTDEEEQELRNATERARLGWGWVGVI